MNLNYPAEAAEAGIEGRVVVTFHISAEGVLGDVELVRGVHPLLDEAALQVVRGIEARFIPACENGRNVASSYTLPIQFKLPPEKAPAAQ